METKRLGAKIARKRSKCPFDMDIELKRRFETLLWYQGSGPEEDYLMELRDYKIQDSTKEFYDKERTQPKPCLVIRYLWLGKTLTYVDADGNEMTIEHGQEYYSFTGSMILIDQAQRDFSKEDLPAQTVISVQANKQNKKFYKFT